MDRASKQQESYWISSDNSRALPLLRTGGDSGVAWGHQREGTTAFQKEKARVQSLNRKRGSTEKDECTAFDSLYRHSERGVEELGDCVGRRR